MSCLSLPYRALEKAQQPGSPVEPNMNVFHDYEPSQDKCFACLGGLAVIEALKVDMHKDKYRKSFGRRGFIENVLDEVLPDYDDLDTINKKRAYKNVLIRAESSLNSLRMGLIMEAVINWYGAEKISKQQKKVIAEIAKKFELPPRRESVFIRVPCYERAPAEFFRLQKELALALKQADL